MDHADHMEVKVMKKEPGETSQPGGWAAKMTRRGGQGRGPRFNAGQTILALVLLTVLVAEQIYSYDSKRAGALERGGAAPKSPGGPVAQRAPYLPLLPRTLKQWRA